MVLVNHDDSDNSHRRFGRLSIDRGGGGVLEGFKLYGPLFCFCYFSVIETGAYV